MSKKRVGLMYHNSMGEHSFLFSSNYYRDNINRQKVRYDPSLAIHKNRQGLEVKFRTREYSQRLEGHRSYLLGLEQAPDKSP